MNSNVTPFPVRRSYLDECRARGVHQHVEEGLAAQAELLAIAARLERSHTAEVQALAGKSGNVATHKTAVDAAMAEFRDRCEAVMEAFEASGLGAAHIGFLRHLMFETSMTPSIASRAFSALAPNKKDHSDDR